MKKLIIAIVAGMMVFSGASGVMAGCCKAEAANKETAKCPMSKDMVQCPAAKAACSEKTPSTCPVKTEAKATGKSKTCCSQAKTAQNISNRASVKGAEHLNRL